MTTSAYGLCDETAAALWLRLPIRRLRVLREHGRGPAWFELPTGEVRYTLEALERWAASGGTTVRAVDTSNLIAFPGVRIRTMLRDKTKPHGRSGRSESWPR